MRSLIPILILSTNLLRAGTALPPDAQTFVERRDRCDHFLGEDPYDAERAALLDRAIEENCSGIDDELDALKHKYSDNAAVLDVLAAYDAPVEP